MFGSYVETVYFCIRNRERCGTETVCDWLGETSVGEFLLYKGFCTRYLTLAGLREREGIRPFGAYSQPPERNWKKTFENIWWLKINLLPLHPLSKSKQRWLTLFLESGSVNESFLCSSFRKRDDGKKERWKKLPKIFGRYT